MSAIVSANYERSVRVRVPGWWVWWVTVRSGMGQVLGVGRPFREKWWPWMLLFLWWIPVLPVVARAVSSSDGPLPHPVGLTFGWVGADPAFLFNSWSVPHLWFSCFPALWFVAYASAKLMIPERISVTEQLYRVRGFGSLKYLSAKTASALLLVSAGWVVPQVLLAAAMLLFSAGSVPLLVPELVVGGLLTVAVCVWWACFYVPLGLLMSAGGRQSVAMSSTLLTALVFVTGVVSHVLAPVYPTAARRVAIDSVFRQIVDRVWRHTPPDWAEVGTPPGLGAVELTWWSVLVPVSALCVLMVIRRVTR